MRALLMYTDRDFSLPEHPNPLAHEQDIAQDLGLDTVLRSMAGDDPFLLAIARSALLTSFANDTGTILHRQEILQDCLRNPALIRELYGIALEAIETRRWTSWRYVSRYPGTALYDAIATLEAYGSVLRRLRIFADTYAARFTSPGFLALIATLEQELNDTFFTEVASHLEVLRFKRGVLASAALGEGNEGVNYVLHQPRSSRPTWVARLLGEQPLGFTIHIAERDQAGAAALSELRDRAIVRAANIAAEAAEHVIGFFQLLATELAFYVACLNLHDALVSLGSPTCVPRPERAGTRALHFDELYDVSLALSGRQRVVGNSLDIDGKSLVIITGANQGGKSSFLRSIGLAQVMMQCGMFVGAEHFVGELCTGLFTHYTREEDPAMKQGKLDEELSRLSTIVDAITPDGMVLFNESFAATNEREGSEIASQVACALVEQRVKVFFVTHLYEFARRLHGDTREDTLFLRAERRPDGTRTFHVLPGEPLATSYGHDLYREIFANGETAAN